MGFDKFYRVDHTLKEINATFTDTHKNILKINGHKGKYHIYDITVELFDFDEHVVGHARYNPVKNEIEVLNRGYSEISSIENLILESYIPEIFSCNKKNAKVIRNAEW